MGASSCLAGDQHPWRCGVIAEMQVHSECSVVVPLHTPTHAHKHTHTHTQANMQAAVSNTVTYHPTLAYWVGCGWLGRIRANIEESIENNSPFRLKKGRDVFP